MLSLRIAAGVAFVAGGISAFNKEWEWSLMFLSMGFGLVYCFETNIPWNQPLSRKNLFKELTEARWQVTILGQLCQFLSLVFLIMYFIVHYA